MYVSISKKLSFVLLCTFIALGMGGCVSGLTITDTDKSNIANPQTWVTWCISPPTKPKLCYDPIDGKYGDSAFVSFDKLATRESSLEYAADAYPDSGKFITSVNGDANTAQMAWKLYRNGKLTTERIGNVIVQNNDQLDLKYEEVK